MTREPNLLCPYSSPKEEEHVDFEKEFPNPTCPYSSPTKELPTILT
jgi:hypothetical protein